MKRPRIGALRHRVTIEAVARTPDGGGGGSESWSAVADVWAAITPAGGTEAVPAEAVAGSITHTIVIRHRTGLLPAMRLRFGQRVFEILAILDPDERCRHLRLSARERDL